MPEERQEIHPDPQRPMYWRFRERSAVLLGGSSQDNLFQVSEAADEMTRLREAGGNYVRCTLSSRDSGNRWPFARRGDGRYDLSQMDERYWQRLADFLQAAHERDVIVQVELWDRFDHGREPYLLSPWNPVNNVNYTAAQSRLALAYPEHPALTDQPFFRSVPMLDHNKVLLGFQQAVVERFCDLALALDNVLWCMDNETHVHPAWGAYWSGYVQDRAARVGRQVFTTQMWDAHKLTDSQHDNTVDHPELYGFVDVSQNTHQQGRDAWDQLQAMRRRLMDSRVPRPMNCVKVYGNKGPHGDVAHGLHGFWCSLMGGCAAVRFHRPPTGLGSGPMALAHVRAARALDEAVDLSGAVAVGAPLGLADDRMQVYACGNAARDRYGVVVVGGGEAALSVRAKHLRWWDWKRQTWGVAAPYRGKILATGSGVAVGWLH